MTLVPPPVSGLVIVTADIIGKGERDAWECAPVVLTATMLRRYPDRSFLLNLRRHDTLLLDVGVGNHEPI